MVQYVLLWCVDIVLIVVVIGCGIVLDRRGVGDLGNSAMFCVSISPLYHFWYKVSRFVTNLVLTINHCKDIPCFWAVLAIITYHMAYFMQYIRHGNCFFKGYPWSMAVFLAGGTPPHNPAPTPRSQHKPYSCQSLSTKYQTMPRKIRPHRACMSPRNSSRNCLTN